MSFCVINMYSFILSKIILLGALLRTALYSSTPFPSGRQLSHNAGVPTVAFVDDVKEVKLGVCEILASVFKSSWSVFACGTLQSLVMIIVLMLPGGENISILSVSKGT